MVITEKEVNLSSYIVKNGKLCSWGDRFGYKSTTDIFSLRTSSTPFSSESSYINCDTLFECITHTASFKGLIKNRKSYTCVMPVWLEIFTATCYVGNSWWSYNLVFIQILLVQDLYDDKSQMPPRLFGTWLWRDTPTTPPRLVVKRFEWATTSHSHMVTNSSLMKFLNKSRTTFYIESWSKSEDGWR